MMMRMEEFQISGPNLSVICFASKTPPSVPFERFRNIEKARIYIHRHEPLPTTFDTYSLRSRNGGSELLIVSIVRNRQHYLLSDSHNGMLGWIYNRPRKKEKKQSNWIQSLLSSCNQSVIITCSIIILLFMRTKFGPLTRTLPFREPDSTVPEIGIYFVGKILMLN